MLKRNGIAPAPERKTTWSTFLKAHAAGLVGADFLTVEVWTLRGLRTFFILFAIRVATRKVEVLGITDRIDDDFRRQAARNLVDDECDAMKGVTHLIIDRDSNYSEAFCGVLKSAAVKVVRTPPRSPNCNPVSERFVLTLRRELLDRMICFGELSLRRAVMQFVEYHYRRERNHQGIENLIPAPEPEVGRTVGEVKCRQRVGGLLRYYYRAA